MNKFFNRPITPHLTIYVPQISSLFSIWHRISSIYIIVYTISCLLIYKSFLFLKIDYFIFISYVMTVLNYLLFISLYYHFFNGVRHIFWDLGLLLTLKYLTKSSILIVTTLLTIQAIFFKTYLL